MSDASTTIHLLGNLLTLRAGSADTGGRFSLVDTLTAPGAGTPPHRQDDEEAFLVLEGTYEFMLDGEVRCHGAGGFVHVPPGTAHGFRNVGEAPARLLIVNLPAGLHEGFFREAGDPVEPGTTAFPPPAAPDIPRLMAAAARHGIEILPPPTG